jgi:1,4-dihydroxy-2-naphthoate octaprenyltransferase
VGGTEAGDGILEGTRAERISSKARLWAVAVRAYAYPASIVPVLLGSVCAWSNTGIFLWGHFLLAILAGMLYHTGCNLINDYYDFKYSVDQPHSYGGSGVLLNGRMTPREIAIGSAASLIAGSAIGLYFVYLYGMRILLVGTAGLFGAIFYTASRYSAKYNAWGEPLVFLTMGVGMVLGSYLVQTGSLSWNALWVSLPISFLVAAILQANDTRDIADDRRSTIKTIATLLGSRGARIFYSTLLFAAYASLCVLAATGVVPWTALLAILSLPIAKKLHGLFWTVREERDERLLFAPHRTALLHLVFGLLMTGGIILGRWVT